MIINTGIFKIIDYERNCGYLNVKLSHDYDRNVFDIELCEATVRSSERRTEILSKYQKEVCFNVKYKVTSTIVDIKWKATYSNYRQDKQIKLSHDYDRNVFDIELCEATIRSIERHTGVLSKYQKELCFNVKYKVTSTIVDIKWKATYSNNTQDKQSNRFYFYTLILLISGYFLIVK
ncbi:unnamed protein product [Rotaria sp. Silwood1]|nr:unnamed protein product [Rotaria sp. Silwood1]